MDTNIFTAIITGIFSLLSILLYRFLFPPQSGGHSSLTPAQQLPIPTIPTPNTYQRAKATQMYSLVIRCPACIADGNTGEWPNQWYHTDCGGEIQIGDDAHLQCVRCGKSSHIKEWKYNCTTHQVTTKIGCVGYHSTTSAHFASAISTAGQIASVAGRSWMLRVLENLGDW
ncbi:MAG: hypothetical protein BWK78_01940 [Thiotrichaceae bacterium IS1]|nr:MAG: hypothetical protein BWK78_01940 [Thiotrichaceae bacterium IS1]